MFAHGVMFQYFHWHASPEGSLWRDLAGHAALLSARGVTSVWIPPAYKGAEGANDRGYAVYDLYDLGEFEQKGARRTRYGEKSEMLAAIAALHEQGVQVYADIVFNQRSGADECEDVQASVVNPEQRNEVEGPPKPIRAWTRFLFPGRGDQHSSMKWHKDHFTAVDCDANAPDARQILLLEGKTFSGEVSFEQGNFDFLMGCDVDTYHPEVREELLAFGTWLIAQTGVDGFRLDALKHIPSSFMRDWLRHVRAQHEGRELFAVGEYWSADLAELGAYLEQVEGTMRLFDVPLHFKLFRAAMDGRDFDLRTIFDDTLVATNPLMAVTFVDNHDTQPSASLESWVLPWFKPLAYALILLRRDGYPCVFHADYFSHADEHGKLVSHAHLIDIFLDARARFGHGDQHDVFDDPTCIAWLRTGDEEHPGAMVVVMSSADDATKRIETCKPRSTFRDATGHIEAQVETDDDGVAEFPCPAGSLSVWLQT
ncbi:MAG: alpha-amylase [Polyangiales bacterium]